MAYDDDNFDDEVERQPRGVKTSRIKGSKVNPKQLNPVNQSGATRYPGPSVDVNDPNFAGDGSDSSIQEALAQQWQAMMLRKMLNPALVDPGSVPDFVGPGSPSDIPGDNIAGGDIGALFDPTLISRQKLRMREGY